MTEPRGMCYKFWAKKVPYNVPAEPPYSTSCPLCADHSKCPGDNPSGLGLRPRVLVCSPYAGDIATNLAYARDCMYDSLRRGEAPLLSHLLYTQVLNDQVPEEREVGLACERAWFAAADYVAFYTDRGMSPGMRAIEDFAVNVEGVVLTFREIRR